MAKTKQKSDDGDCLTRQQIAALWGVNAQQFDRRFRPLIPAKFIVASGTGQRTLFKPAAVRAIADALVKQERERHAGGSASEPAGDAELRRLRKIQADREEFKLAQERGEYIRIGAASQILAIAANRIRRAGELIERKHGAGAAELLEDALNESAREMEKTFGNDGNNPT